MNYLTNTEEKECETYLNIYKQSMVGNEMFNH